MPLHLPRRQAREKSVEYTHVAIYHADYTNDQRGSMDGPFYEFHEVTDARQPEAREIGPQGDKRTGRLVALIPLTPQHQEDFRKAAGRLQWETGALGWIAYARDGNTAISRSLYPKNKLMDYEARYKSAKRPLQGLGAQLERVCLSHLKTLGITHVRTTHAPAEPRVRQLEKLGLPIDEEVPIDEWMQKLEAGFPLGYQPDAEPRPSIWRRIGGLFKRQRGA